MHAPSAQAHADAPASMHSYPNNLQLKEAAAAGKGSQLKANQAALTLKCHVCLQLFICTTTEAKMREHAENKHPKSDVYVSGKLLPAAVGSHAE